MEKNKVESKAHNFIPMNKIEPNTTRKANKMEPKQLTLKNLAAKKKERQMEAKSLSLKNLAAKKKQLKFQKLSENPIPVLETMSTEDIEKLLKEASFEYYKGNPLLSDDIFDIAKNYLAKRDPSNPFLNEIGAVAPGQKVKLPYWMGSLDKIREDESALEKWKTKHAGSVIISDKLDGNSALLIYSKGSFKMYSRGDGFEGQDISHVVPYIQGVPKDTKEFPDSFAVRGELIISKERWAPLFAKKKGANARNAVAGVMHSKTPDAELANAVEFVAYELLHPRKKPEESMTILGTQGFRVVYHEKKNSSELTMESLSKILIHRRNVSPYEVDGIVVFHNDEHNQVSGKNPSYAFAFKSILTHEEAEVIVKEVTWNISKDGYLKPLIHFDPVVLSGASIQKATGFNGQFIEEHVIGPGSRIVIIRSGDVIPHVVRILTKSASGTPSFPDAKTFPWKWNETHVDIVLVDKSSAKEVIIRQMEHFASSLGIKGVGKGVIERFYENNITSVKKLIEVDVDTIVKMEGFQKKSAEKIVKEIRDTVQRSECLDFMVASNIFGRAIAEKKLKLILEKFPSILDNKSPTEEQLSSIDGIGPITAKQCIDALPLFFEFMKDIGIPCKQTVLKPVESKKSSLAHLQVVFTGVRDKELEEEIEARGGKVSTSVSKKVSVVIAKNPDEETGKVKAAKELDIKVVSLEQFKKDYM